MQIKKREQKQKNSPFFLRFKENKWSNEQLNAITLFPYVNIHAQGKYLRTVLNFSFKDLDFNKKKVLPFFLAMELLTNQKCIVTLSSKNILFWKLRKGMLVGCKVTLRKDKLEDFFDNLLLASARMERYTSNKTLEFLNKKVEKKVGMKKKVKKNEGLINTNFFLLKLSELLFFYPIELGLGINSEVRKVEINMIFNSWAFEEKIFMLTSKKIPLKLR